MSNTKKNVLKFSFAYVLIFALTVVIAFFCKGKSCAISEDGVLVSTLYVFLPLIPIFLFSFVTYKMREGAFRAWWNFARWWAPLLLIVFFLLSHASGGGELNMGQDFTAFFLFVLYSIWVVVSAVKIWRAFQRSN